VRKGLSRNETRSTAVVVVQAPAADVEKRVGPWATLTPIDDTSCRVELDALDTRWAAFGLGVLGAPFTIETATDELRTELAAWADRFAAALA
jgi:hypothetical protein